jgi:hypothetical protein
VAKARSDYSAIYVRRQRRKKDLSLAKGVQPLVPTNEVKPPERVKFDSGKTMPKWYADCWSLPKEERAGLRSKTFPGFAQAMAEQWG